MKIETIAIAVLMSVVSVFGQTTVYYTNVGSVQQYHYSAGDIWPDEISRAPMVDLSADGEITSVSLMPFFTAFDSTGRPLPGQLPFELFMVASRYGAWSFEVDPRESFTADPTLFLGDPGYNPSAVTFGIGGHAEAPAYFISYRRDHIAEEQTFTFGFEVESLTYTAVPEPGTWALMLLGGLALLGKRMMRQ